jgi:acetyl-CoA C-acetyltransferase
VTGPDVRVAGVGMTSFGKLDDATALDLSVSAVAEAITDSGVDPAAIEAAFFGAAGEFALGQRTLVELGVGGIPVLNTENACATSSTAFYLAHVALRAGEFETVVVGGAHSYAALRRGDTGPGAANLARFDRDFAAGLSLPGIYALLARRHMEDHGTTLEQLALVSVKNHEHGLLNPKAQYHLRLTVDEVLNSRLIADPLTLYHCCPRTDGAAAVVLTTRPGAAGPRVRSCVLGAGSVAGSADERGWGVDLVADTAGRAYARAAVDPADVDVFEVHDAFTIGEVLSYEGLGLCPVGEGGRLIQDRVTWLGGRHVVNPSGGLIARGHPVTATGVAMIAEIAKQLAGGAGAYQVEGARLGVAETMGGGTAGISGNACTVTVLEAA